MKVKSDGLICWSCGRPTDVTGRPTRNDACSSCMADLRCCRGCRHFDPNRRFQCRESIDTNVVIKDKNNFCDFFQPRTITKTAGGMSRGNTPDSKDERRKSFDDLFDD